MSFEKEFNQERLAVKKALEETVRVTAISLFSGVITSSPVGNPSLWKNPKGAAPGYSGGQFRSNWFLSLGAPSTKITESTKEENQRISEVNSIATSKYSSVYALTNNLPYAQRIENGWSSQSESGVVAPNVSRVNSQLPKIAAVSNKKYGVQ
jgi:hypothetical protein